MSYDSKDESFLERRRKGLGGTDMGSIMGLNPYKTSHEVYLEKTEGYQKDLSGNDAIKRGVIFEQPVADLYELETGKTLYCTSTIVHDKYPFLIANPDRLIPEESRGLEIKTVGRFSQKEWGESGSQKIPEHYYMQIAHYMMVLNYKYWDLAALFHDYEMRVYSFERNPQIDEIILECGEFFWKNHVEKRNPPDIDFKNPHAKELIKSIYKTIDEKTITLSDDFIPDVEAMIYAKKQIKDWKETHDISESRILNAMGNSESAILSNGNRFFRKLVKRNEYIVKPSQYIRLDYRKAKEERCE